MIFELDDGTCLEASRIVTKRTKFAVDKIILPTEDGVLFSTKISGIVFVPDHALDHMIFKEVKRKKK